MQNLTRLTFDPEVMGGKPCIRGMRVTVGMIVGLVASGKTVDEVLVDYPYLVLLCHKTTSLAVAPLATGTPRQMV
jgi:uncharacterized protein (DUF433 family)